MSTVPAEQGPFDLIRPATTPAPMLGRTEPRLWTPPLRELTPETSYGFAACEFATKIQHPLDPWQEWLAIHGGELLPDGRPRFRIVLVLVARQNGKTELLVVLSLFWLFEEKRPLTLGTSLLLEAAQESWEKALSAAQDDDDLRVRIPIKGGVRRTNGQQTITTTDNTRYKIAAANRRAGRSKTIDRLIMDEVREQDTWVAYNAGIPAMNAVRDGQAWLISNQGDDSAVVLDSLRADALAYLETGQGDERLGIFEWSAPDGSDVTDPDAIAQANPNVGRRLDLDNLLAEAGRAKRAGGEQLAGFKTEGLCMRVHQLNPAIDPGRWSARANPTRTMAAFRDRVVTCLDVSLDGLHATLMAACEAPGGLVLLEVIKAWYGPLATRTVRRELPGILDRVKPKVFAYFPNGPAASVAVHLAKPNRRAGRVPWPPVGTTVRPIVADVPAVCMGLSELVDAGDVSHPDDDLLNQHIASAQKLHVGDQWRFARRGSGPIDAAYAAAGAAHEARALPAGAGPLIVA